MRRSAVCKDSLRQLEKFTRNVGIKAGIGSALDCSLLKGEILNWDRGAAESMKGMGAGGGNYDPA
jgi:hypothetical protein